MAAQAASDHESRAILARQSAALARADGHRLRKNAARHCLELPFDQVRRRQAYTISSRPRQPGETDAQRVSAVCVALQQL